MNWLLPVTLAGLLATGAAAQDAAHPSSDVLTRGKAVFGRRCAMCHSEGRMMAGTEVLAAKYGNTKPALLEKRTDLTPEIVKLFVRRGMNVMPRFRKTEVDDQQLDALASYLSRNSPR